MLLLPSPFLRAYLLWQIKVYPAFIKRPGLCNLRNFHTILNTATVKENYKVCPLPLERSGEGLLTLCMQKRNHHEIAKEGLTHLSLLGHAD